MQCFFLRPKECFSPKMTKNGNPPGSRFYLGGGRDLLGCNFFSPSMQSISRLGVSCTRPEWIQVRFPQCVATNHSTRFPPSFSDKPEWPGGWGVISTVTSLCYLSTPACVHPPTGNTILEPLFLGGLDFPSACASLLPMSTPDTHFTVNQVGMKGGGRGPRHDRDLAAARLTNHY